MVHVLVSEKSPVIQIAFTSNCPGAAGKMEICWGALVVPTACTPKLKFAGEATGGLLIPCPVNATVIGWADAPKSTVSDPDLGPMCCGLKLTAIEQLRKLETAPLQELVC